LRVRDNDFGQLGRAAKRRNLAKEDGVAVNILVADDSVTMRRILELTFQGEDANVTTVESAEAAVRKASEAAPDVVFADLSMSGMDGYALATAIKSTPGLERTAVVVMASQKHPYDEEKGKGAGVDDHILKPFDSQHVIDRVKQVLAKPRVAPAAARAAQPAAAAAPNASRVGSKTIAFGKSPTAGPLPGPAPAAARPQPSAAAAPAFAQPAAPPAFAPQAAPAFAAPAAVAKPAPAVLSAVATSASADFEHKLGNLGLSAEQVAAVLSLSRDVVERVVWEVVPDLAETLIKEEIRRLTAS
jgi:CheY-like chemotaxis protein